ncbi:MAG: glycoside hydrolase family 15 protein [Pseudomonadota bacterium]
MRDFAAAQDLNLPMDAPGRPGIAPTWSSSAKDAVGCSLGLSRLWFTTGFGIINEVYYPRVDIPQIRDLGFIVADGRGFWSEVKRLENYTVHFVAPGVAALEICHEHPRYTLRLRISPDPRRDVLAIEVCLDGDEELRPYVLLAPHLGATGYGNRATVGHYRGRCVLLAEQGPFALALAAVDACQQDAFGAASAGYVGRSDGWQDFACNGALTWHYPNAGPGNVALTGELPRRAVLALGFGSSPNAAATLAISSLLQPFDNILQHQIADWESWQARHSERYALPLDIPESLRRQFQISAMVLRTHLDKTYPGAMVASLSVPWGDTGEERGGYHLVWPRDLVECAGALLALGAEEEARDTLRYLIASQHDDGHWSQNQWLGGKAFWGGIQLDETAFPVLLAAALAERDALGGIEIETMVRRALGFIAVHGPVTDQDRWEENTGINGFTLAACIAALVAGSAFLSSTDSEWALDLADYWNNRIEHWLVARDTTLTAQLGVKGYYVRTAPLEVLQEGAAALRRSLPIRNREDGLSLLAEQQVATDFLQLVRFGLRLADDPLMLDSLTVVDHLLKVDTPAGAVWRRYNGDGYGEHDDGRAYDGTGRGRPWPLLTGERGHFELAAGRDPLPCLATMAGLASRTGLIPEQIWDGAAVPMRRLAFGRPTGSAMPLAWAHAEFVKLMVSRHTGVPLDRPKSVWSRYQGHSPKIWRAFWSLKAPMASFIPGLRLVILLPRPATIHWGIDGWQAVADVATLDTQLGFHVADLDTRLLKPGQRVDFTFRWQEDNAWVGSDYYVSVASD